MLLLLLACKPETVVEPLECSASVSDTMNLAVSVAWTTDADATSTVEFGKDDAYGLTTPEVSGGDVALDLLGLPEGTDVHWRGVSTFADGSTAECMGVTTNGDLPIGLPEFEVEKNTSASQDSARFAIGAMFEGAGGRGGQVTLVAMDRSGAIVWYFLGDESATGLDVHYARDGAGLLYNVFDGQMGGETATIRKISLLGEPLGEWETPLAHHMFTELPDGTLAWQAIDARWYTDPETKESDTWVGDAVVETAPDGTSTTIFSTWDVLDAHGNDRSDAVSIYGGVDWTHGNNLVYDEQTEGYVLSLGHADDILTLARDGTVTNLWGLDGLPVDPQFDYQHDVHPLDNGNLLMFMTDDDGAGAIEYSIGDDGLTEVWRGPSGHKPFALGQARRLANGNTFVNGGAGWNLYEVTPEGDTVWEVSVGGEGAIFGQFQMVESLYAGE